MRKLEMTLIVLGRLLLAVSFLAAALVLAAIPTPDWSKLDAKLKVVEKKIARAEAAGFAVVREINKARGGE